MTQQLDGRETVYKEMKQKYRCQCISISVSVCQCITYLGHCYRPPVRSHVAA